MFEVRFVHPVPAAPMGTHPSPTFYAGKLTPLFTTELECSRYGDGLSLESAICSSGHKNDILELRVKPKQFRV